MSLRNILKSSGSAMLAALLASTALSADAHARENDRRGGGQSSQVQQGRSGGWQGGGGQNWRGGGSGRSESRPSMDRSSRMPSEGDYRSRAAAPDQAPRGNWNDRGNDNRMRPSAPVVQARPQPDRDSATRSDRGSWNAERRNSTERSRTYSDPDRNRSYTERRANTRAYSDRRDGSDYRERNTRWSSDRDRNWSGAYRQGYRDGDRKDWNDRDRRYSNYSRWKNDWRHDRRYDWYSYRNSYRHIYRPGPYYSPYRHHHYSRLSIGFYLNSGFYGNNYWLSDPSYYRLPPAYGPYRWVRYYDDVLLVDIYSGEVVDVIYDFFW